MDEKKSIRHAARNWLHYLLLAFQAVDASIAGKQFAQHHPLDIQGVRSEHHWTTWGGWVAFLEELFAPLHPLHVKYDVPRHYPDVEARPPEVHLRWRMQFWIRTRQPRPIKLDCKATLIEEEGRLVATVLHFRALGHQNE